jgi:fumarate reductase subunit D
MIARTARRLGHRTNLLWLAAMLHRFSGLGLAVFLPLHFLTLGLAVEGEARLESFLRWSDAPTVKVSEAVLMFLLAVHALGGLRLLVLENLAWYDAQKRNAALATVMAAAIAVVFLAWIF